jgi:alkylation response protein AidB-like acyl-CoA dehydrogenase
MRTIDGESHFCEVFLDEARVPIENRIGTENDGWRVANVTLRFERGTAFAQHIINLRGQLLRVASLARARRAGGASADGLRAKMGRLHANVEALWRMTQMCVAEAEELGAPSPLGSAVKLRYSELCQEIAQLAVRVVGRPVLGAVELDGDHTGEIAREYLWSLQATIAAGTSQIQRNLIAQRILGMPKPR